jgi:hypothetical protein
MPNLWAAAYLAPPPTSRDLPSKANRLITAFYSATQADSLPFDIGDDPAFFSASYFNGPITWGVCRHDVRSAIHAGDWMVFFSARRACEGSDVTQYRFVAALCVETKLSQAALFGPDRHHPYCEYLNLLIRPKEHGWEHFEPTLTAWHNDWLWRISDKSALQRQGLKKEDLVEAGRRHVSGEPLTVGGKPVPVGNNYIVFAKSPTLVADEPPLVASHRTGMSREIWEMNARASLIHDLVFGSSSRGLRTGNPSQPHRHFRRALQDTAFQQRLRDALMLAPNEREVPGAVSKIRGRPVKRGREGRC